MKWVGSARTRSYAGRLDLDLAGAVEIPAFADDGHRVRQQPERLVQVLDLLVDAPVERLVSADFARGFIHQGFVQHG